MGQKNLFLRFLGVNSIKKRRKHDIFTQVFSLLKGQAQRFFAAGFHQTAPPGPSRVFFLTLHVHPTPIAFQKLEEEKKRQVQLVQKYKRIVDIGISEG